MARLHWSRARCSLVALAAPFALAPLALSQSPGSDGPAFLVRDIRAQPSSVSSYPFHFVAVGDDVYFTASPQAFNGRELWRTNGTPSGTVRVAALPPEAVYELGPDHLTARRATLMFTVGRRDAGVELWTSDGTEAGTRLVKDVRPGEAGSNPADLVAAGDVLFFTADDGESGRELWRSDGTEQGTVRVADLNAGPQGSLPEELTRVGERVYFTAVRSGLLRELWMSDGTAAGTVPVGGVPASLDALPPQGLTAVGSTLFLVAEDAEAGAEPWRVDTNGVAMRVHDVNPGPEGSGPRTLVDRDGELCFFAFHPDDRDLWCTDGTAEGSTGIATGAVLTGQLTASGGLLYFSAREQFPRTEVHPGRDLWRSDGTSAGTFRLGQLHDDTRGRPSVRLVDFAGTLLYGVNGGLPSGQRLGRSDGTPEGTFIILSQGVTGLTATAGAAYFAACDSEQGCEPWTSDGTAEGSLPLHDIAPGADSAPAELTAFGDVLIFRARGDDHTGLWLSGGTAAGAVPVPSDGASDLGGLLPTGSFVLFSARHPETGHELWRTDGRESALVRDIRPGLADSNISYLSSVDGFALFQADDGSAAGAELWRSDGTAAGTFMVRDLHPAGDSHPFGFTVLGDDAYFAARDDVGFELWRTDGTAAGTARVKDINPGPDDSIPLRLVAAGELLFFRATDALHDVELWRSDGTAAGTVRVRDLNPGNAPSFPSGLTALRQGVVVFAADDGVHGVEPWRSDGSEAGTFPLGDLFVGPASSITAPTEPDIRFTAAGHHAFFVAEDATHGRELWRTDGTVEGTRLVRDVFAGTGHAFAPQVTGGLTAIGPLLLFAAFEPDTGLELWRSDGSERGTQRVQDIARGPTSASPYGLTAAGVSVFFAANDHVRGVELWAAPRRALNPACAGDCDEDGAVVVAELVLGVNLLLERGDPSACIAVDRDLDGQVIVAELIAAVGRTLGGCAALSCSEPIGLQSHPFLAWIT